MRTMKTAVLALTAAFLASSAQAEGQRGPTPVPIEDWSLSKVSTLGREIYIQDRAAWVATDALREALSPTEMATVRGWVVLGEGSSRTVRFLKADGDDVAPGWDIPVEDGRAGAPVAASDAEMDGETRLRFLARQTAVAGIGALRCGTYNSVVARDPDGDGWLVWLLAGTTARGMMPVGGHYRFRVSADGTEMQTRDQLSNRCLNMQANPPAGPQGQPAAVVVSHIVSDGPVETHVFLSLQFRVPIYVAARDRLFAVEGNRIRPVDMSRQ